MTITEIYEQYKIMPNLQLHQLRVAAVAEQICESSNIPVDKNTIVLACLLHDMGNIIKSNFNNNLFGMTEEDKKYWEEIKQDFIKQYGDQEIMATLAILKELSIDNQIKEIIQSNDFSHICEIQGSDSIERKIVKYADLRVGPHGVLTLQERLDEASKRYGKWEDTKSSCCFEIEKQIFSHSSLKPEDITDESIKDRLEKLRNTKI